MEEVVQIVGAEISCAALGDIRVQLRGVRLGSGRIKSAPLAVLQRHMYPVEQLRGSVRGDPRFYSRHHVASLRAASFGTVRTAWIYGSASFSQASLAPVGWVRCEN